MKTCSSCGTVNWSIVYDSKKEPVCSGCDKKMKDYRCRPSYGTAVAGAGNFRVMLMPQSDERAGAYYP